MTRNYLLYVTIALAVALFLMTVPYWAWYVIDALFIDDSNDPVLAGVPPSWSAHQWESGNRTEAHYLAEYADCTLHVTKSGTNTTTITVDSSLVCSQEDGGRTITSYDDQDIEFDTVPADFEVDWTADECRMESSYSAWDGQEDGSVKLRITCAR